MALLALGAIGGIAYGRRGLKTQPRQEMRVRSHPFTMLLLFLAGAALALWLAQYLI